MAGRHHPRSGGSTRRELLERTAALGIGSLAAACGQLRAPREQAGQQPSSRQPVTLVWSPWDGEGQAIVDGANRGIGLYRKTHLNVSFELVPQQGFSAKMDAMIAADSGPDIMSGNGASWRDRAVQGQFLGLDPFIKRDLKANWKDDYVPAHVNVFNLKETGQFSLPMYLGTMALYYNKAWFRAKGIAPPDASWDWDKWTEAMQKLIERPDKFGAWLLTISRTRSMMFVKQNNGNMVALNDDTKCVIDQPAALAALNWIRDRYWKDHLSIQQPETQGQNVTQAFSAGRIATFIEGSWRLAPMALEVPPGVEWDVAVLPRKVRRSTRATTDGWGVWRGSKNQEPAWEFMKWLQGDDWHEIMMGVVGLTPARVSQLDKWAKLTAKAYPNLDGKNFTAFTAPVKEKWAEPEEFFRFHKAATDIIDPLYNKAVRDGQEAVDSTFKEAARQVSAVQAQLKGQSGK